MNAPPAAAFFCQNSNVDTSGRSGNGLAQLLPPRVEGVRSPRPADDQTLRMCTCEQDAIAASVALSGLTYREIASRMGKSKTLIGALVKGERGLSKKLTTAFCNATGTTLILQYRDFETALRLASGHQRERDRIAAIVAPTERAWHSAA